MNPPYQDPLLPGEPTQEDLAPFTQLVAEMDMSQPAAPVAQPRAAKGLSFDWSVLNAQTQEEYDAKPPAIQHLIHEIQTQGILPSQEQAANRVMEIQKMLDERNSPQAKAQVQSTNLSAQKTKLDIEKLEKEKISAAKDQAEVSARKQLIFEKIDKYTNSENPEYTPLNALVGKWDGTAGAMLDAGGMNDQRAAQRAELSRLVSSDILELTKFLKPIAGTDLDFLRSMVPKIHQNDTIWTDYLRDSKKVLEAMTTPPAATQQAAPQAVSQSYASPEDVKAAVRSGKLDRAAAVQVLRTQFNLK